MRAAGVATLLILALAAAPAAAAPYSSVTAVGKTGGGILRFPQAVAYDDSGVADPAGAPVGPYVYVADQYSFLVQKFTRGGTFVRQWGGFGTGARAVRQRERRHGRRDRRPRGRRAGSRVRARLLQRPHPAVHPGRDVRAQLRLDRHGAGPVPARHQRRAGDPGQLAVRGRPEQPPRAALHARRDRRAGRHACGVRLFGTGDGQLDHPQGLGVDATAVYVADDRNDRVVKFSHDGVYLGKTTGNATAPFNFAYDAGVDSLGRLYVADNNNHRVQEFDAATFAYRRRWGLLGTEPGRFGYPRSLAGVKGDPAGGVFVGNTSNNRVDAFAPDATARGSFGINARGPGLFMQPKSVAAGKDGALWVADTFSDRVQKLTATGDFVASYSRVSTFGPAPGGAAGEFRNPYGVAVDPVSGAVYVADTGNHRVQRFDGAAWTVVAGATFNAPRGVGVDASGRLLVADTGNDRVLRLSGTTWSTVGSGFARPEAVTAQGTSVYVADTGNSRVLKLDATTGAGSARWRPPSRRASRSTRAGTSPSPTLATIASCASMPAAPPSTASAERHRDRPADQACPGQHRGRRRARRRPVQQPHPALHALDLDAERADEPQRPSRRGDLGHNAD